MMRSNSAHALHQNSVLMVESDGAIREAFAMLLRASFLKVIHVHDGDEALALLRTQPRPRVLLLDMLRAAESTIALLRHLSTDPALAGIPAVLLGGEATLDGDNVHRFEAPIDLDAVLDCVRGHCRRSAAPPRLS